MAAPTEEDLERWFPALQFGLLTLATGVAVASQHLFKADLALSLTLAAATAAWIGWWTLLRPARAGSRRYTVHYTGRTVLALVLTLANPFFSLFAFVGYLDPWDAFRGKAAYVGLGVTAVIMAASQSGGLPPEDGLQFGIFLVLLAVNAGLAGFFSHLSDQMVRLSTERAETIDEISAANARLEAALTENRALQEQLVAQARQTGVEEERTRLAREIHDTIAQALTGVVAQIEAARTDSSPLSARTHLDRALSLARHGLVEARRSVQGLGPEPLESASLPEALRDLVRDWTTRHEIPAEFVTTGPTTHLHPEIEATVLRVAQESLTNAARHARAGRVGVTLAYMGDEVSLDVRDDGVGFDAQRGPAEGSFGLHGMRQRAERVAGVLEVESEPDGGTAVSIRLPAITRSVA